MASLSHSFRMTATAVAICLVTTSCATLNDFSSSNSNTTNCLAGGVLGALAGAAAVAAAGKGDQGALIAGAAVGAAAGCGLALYYKNRLQRLEQLAREENLTMQVETLQTPAVKVGAAPEEAGIVAQVQDEGMFPLGSATLSTDGQRQVRKLASAFAGKPGEKGTTAILVVGHTDATGSAATNQALSERRARAVASILAEQGIAKERMYFQGAGASRPIADNTDPLQRGKNRRVEIVEVNDRATLVKRVNAEQNNPKYLAHGTATSAPKKSTPIAATGSKTEQPGTAKPGKPAARAVNRALVDFGGQPARGSEWNLAQSIKPKSGGFAIISSAYANEIPVSGCQADTPRLSGEVKSFATGASLNEHATRDYLPGMNGRAWASLVNGHLVTLSPVAVLRDNATLVQNPKVYVTRDYANNKGKANDTLAATANTYEGEDAILYRVFVDQPNKAPVSCIDVVLRKAGDKSLDGTLYYDNGGEPYAAAYAPVRG
ncbi:OmpA family protein [Phytopseudomonas seleniipraecipitans]|uniref:Outer membrane protein OmpA n=1 Tax=Phytopseudomonas seleniipraecipitans TaxID=640205 RepID=A0A1G7JYS7_9GAMM|nr:OmpA family protein [Pseudomonas seleniipraecipitans]SDF29995.1 Outer membrane protein OmpA [Pseudomonas seleniipraecipitans]